MKCIAVFMTSGSEAEAKRISKGLVRKGLAACVSITGPVRSVYVWKGRTEDSKEFMLIAKTTEALFGKLERAVRKMHSYECPEIVALPIKAGSADYLEWIRKSVKRGQHE